MTVTRTDLASHIATNANLSKKKAATCVDQILSGICEALRAGDKVELRGFGSFRVRRRNPRLGRNPKTGESVNVPAKLVVYFKPGKDLTTQLAAWIV